LYGHKGPDRIGEIEQRGVVVKCIRRKDGKWDNWSKAPLE